MTVAKLLELTLGSVKGIFNYGKWVRLVNSGEKTINTNIKNVEMIKYGKGRRFAVNSSTTGRR